MKYITKKQVAEHLSDDVTLLEFNHNVSYDLDLAHIYLEDFLNGYTDYAVQFINYKYLVIYESEELKTEHCYNIDDLDSDFTITGYSQGDAIAVKLVGDVSISKEFLSNLFYDVPVSGKLEIVANNKLLDELYLEEFLDNGYHWDKVQVINNISNAYLKKDYHALLVEYLVENLPEELEYI